MHFIFLLLAFTCVVASEQSDSGTPYDTEWANYACQGKKLELYCQPNKKLKIKQISWGSANSDSCGASTSPVSDCKSPDELESLLRQLCDDKQTCSFESIPRNQDDGCQDQRKLLEVQYSCYYPYTTKSICEDEVLELSCPTGQGIRVLEAFYGVKVDVSMCSTTAESTECNSKDDIHEKIQRLCDTREQCDVRVSNNYLEDPCPGTPKQLHVKYICDTCENAHNDNDKCEQWAGEGECDSNVGWMHENCRKSCWNCMNTRREDCDNLDSHSSCETWASQGECFLNPNYMTSNCAKSCGTCPDVSFNPEELVTYTATVCEGQLIQANCGKGGLVLRIKDLHFGRKDANTCSHDSVFTTDCPTEEGTVDKGRALCDGRNLCLLSADTGMFGDPCNGTFKYLKVDHTCQKCEDKLGNNECEALKNQNKCSTDREYMLDYCFKTCTRCDKAECGNVYDSNIDCDRWSMMGYCESNPDWMNERCRESCRKCTSNERDTCYNEFGTSQCVQWANEDECDKNPYWMREKCQRACGKCADSDCYDKNLNCIYWKSIGECSKNADYMNTYCAKACDVCDHEKETGCHNALGTDYICDMWKSEGACTNSEAFMRPSCAKSCNFC